MINVYHGVRKSQRSTVSLLGVLPPLVQRRGCKKICLGLQLPRILLAQRSPDSSLQSSVVPREYPIHNSVLRDGENLLSWCPSIVELEGLWRGQQGPPYHLLMSMGWRPSTALSTSAECAVQHTLKVGMYYSNCRGRWQAWGMLKH